MPTREGINFNRIIDAGNRVSPGDNIDGLLTELKSGSTAIEFPPGRYTIGDQLNLQGVGRWGIIGTGDSQRDTVFDAAATGGISANDGLRPNRWLESDGDTFLMKNFSLDTGGGNVWTDYWCRANNGLIKNYEHLGKVPHENRQEPVSDSLTMHTTLGCTDVNGVIEIDGYFIRQGGDMPDYPNGLGGIRIYSSHRGEVHLNRGHLEALGSSPIRHSNWPGVFTVTNTFIRNCGNTIFRVHNGNHPSKRSTVRNCVAVVDQQFDHLPYQPVGGTFQTPVSVFQLGSDTGEGGVLYENVKVCNPDIRDRSRIFRVASWEPPGRITWRNCQFHAVNPSDGWFVSQGSGGPYVFEGCDFTGSGTVGGGSATIRDSCVSSGLSLVGSTSNVSRSGCVTADCGVEIPGQEPDCQGDADCEASLVCQDGRCIIPPGLSPSDLQHMLTIQSADGTSVNYTLETTDILLPAAEPGQADTVGPFSANGWTTNTPDEYAFDGEISTLSVHEGNPMFTINGQQTTSPDEVKQIVSGDDGGDDQPPGDGTDDQSGIPVTLVAGGAIALGVVLRDRD